MDEHHTAHIDIKKINNAYLNTSLYSKKIITTPSNILTPNSNHQINSLFSKTNAYLVDTQISGRKIEQDAFVKVSGNYESLLLRKARDNGIHNQTSVGFLHENTNLLNRSSGLADYRRNQRREKLSMTLNNKLGISSNEINSISVKTKEYSNTHNRTTNSSIVRPSNSVVKKPSFTPKARSKTPTASIGNKNMLGGGSKPRPRTPSMKAAPLEPKKPVKNNSYSVPKTQPEISQTKNSRDNKENENIDFSLTSLSHISEDRSALVVDKNDDLSPTNNIILDNDKSSTNITRKKIQSKSCIFKDKNNDNTNSTFGAIQINNFNNVTAKENNNFGDTFSRIKEANKNNTVNYYNNHVKSRKRVQMSLTMKREDDERNQRVGFIVKYNIAKFKEKEKQDMLKKWHEIEDKIEKKERILKQNFDVRIMNAKKNRQSSKDKHSHAWGVDQRKFKDITTNGIQSRNDDHDRTNTLKKQKSVGMEFLDAWRQVQREENDMLVMENEEIKLKKKGKSLSPFRTNTIEKNLNIKIIFNENDAPRDIVVYHKKKEQKLKQKKGELIKNFMKQQKDERLRKEKNNKEEDRVKKEKIKENLMKLDIFAKISGKIPVPNNIQKKEKKSKARKKSLRLKRVNGQSVLEEKAVTPLASDRMGRRKKSEKSDYEKDRSYFIEYLKTLSSIRKHSPELNAITSGEKMRTGKKVEKKAEGDDNFGEVLDSIKKDLQKDIEAVNFHEKKKSSDRNSGQALSSRSSTAEKLDSLRKLRDKVYEKEQITQELSFQKGKGDNMFVKEDSRTRGREISNEPSEDISLINKQNSMKSLLKQQMKDKMNFIAQRYVAIHQKQSDEELAMKHLDRSIRLIQYHVRAYLHRKKIEQEELLAKLERKDSMRNKRHSEDALVYDNSFMRSMKKLVNMQKFELAVDHLKTQSDGQSNRKTSSISSAVQPIVPSPHLAPPAPERNRQSDRDVIMGEYDNSERVVHMSTLHTDIDEDMDKIGGLSPIATTKREIDAKKSNEHDDSSFDKIHQEFLQDIKEDKLKINKPFLYIENEEAEEEEKVEDEVEGEVMDEEELDVEDTEEMEEMEDTEEMEEMEETKQEDTQRTEEEDLHSMSRNSTSRSKALAKVDPSSLSEMRAMFGSEALLRQSAANAQKLIPRAPSETDTHRMATERSEEESDFEMIASSSRNLFDKNSFQDFMTRKLQEIIESRDFSNLIDLREQALEYKEKTDIRMVDSMYKHRQYSPRTYESKRYEIDRWLDQEREELKRLPSHGLKDLERITRKTAEMIKQTCTNADSMKQMFKSMSASDTSSIRNAPYYEESKSLQESSSQTQHPLYLRSSESEKSSINPILIKDDGGVQSVDDYAEDEEEEDEYEEGVMESVSYQTPESKRSSVRQFEPELTERKSSDEYYIENSDTKRHLEMTDEEKLKTVETIRSEKAEEEEVRTVEEDIKTIEEQSRYQDVESDNEEIEFQFNSEYNSKEIQGEGSIVSQRSANDKSIPMDLNTIVLADEKIETERSTSTLSPQTMIAQTAQLPTHFDEVSEGVIKENKEYKLDAIKTEEISKISSFETSKIEEPLKQEQKSISDVGRRMMRNKSVDKLINASPKVTENSGIFQRTLDSPLMRDQYFMKNFGNEEHEDDNDSADEVVSRILKREDVSIHGKENLDTDFENLRNELLFQGEGMMPKDALNSMFEMVDYSAAPSGDESQREKFMSVGTFKGTLASFNDREVKETLTTDEEATSSVSSIDWQFSINTVRNVESDFETSQKLNNEASEEAELKSRPQSRTSSMAENVLATLIDTKEVESLQKEKVAERITDEILLSLVLEIKKELFPARPNLTLTGELSAILNQENMAGAAEGHIDDISLEVLNDAFKRTMFGNEENSESQGNLLLDTKKSDTGFLKSLLAGDRKGIKTDGEAITKYCDEVIQAIQDNIDGFADSIIKPVKKDPLDMLTILQNAPIGSYDHVEHNGENVPILNTDLYLALERLKDEAEGRALSGVINTETSKNDSDALVVEAEHIHNKLIFDCINEALSIYRPYSNEGEPMPWSTKQRVIKKESVENIDKVLSSAKETINVWQSYKAGTLPKPEFILNGIFDEDYFADVAEKRLAALLANEVIESEDKWINYEFEEAQVKIDLADMILENLVIETVDILTAIKEGRR